MIPSQYELKYFLEVAHTLNISRAAERLGITQPALTHAIQRLEAALSTLVLVRTKTGVTLTKSGQKLALHSKHLLQEWEKLKGDILKEEETLSGRYTLGCHESVALYSLSHFLPKLLKENSALNIRLTHNLSRRIAEDVISFKVDFGIVVNPPPHPDLIIKTLFQDVVTLWTSSAKTNRDVLICDPELIQSQSILNQLSKKNIHFQRLVTSSSLEVITSLTASGAGIGIIPTRVATRLPHLHLKPFNKTAPQFHDRICLIYRADTQTSKASKKIAHFIQQSLS